MNVRLAYTFAACSLAILPALAQAPGLASINTQLRAQETKDSQLMWWLHEVTDVYGPRLTGSPGLRAAQDFAVGQMVKWGFSNVHLEAWNFNHPGWQNWDLEANAVSPFQQPLNVRAVSWTPGTNGPVQGAVLVVSARVSFEGSEGTLTSSYALSADGKVLYKKLGSVDLLELRRTILANADSEYSGFNKYWQAH